MDIQDIRKTIAYSICDKSTLLSFISIDKMLYNTKDAYFWQMLCNQYNIPVLTYNCYHFMNYDRMLRYSHSLSCRLFLIYKPIMLKCRDIREILELSKFDTSRFGYYRIINMLISSYVVDDAFRIVIRFKIREKLIFTVHTKTVRLIMLHYANKAYRLNLDSNLIIT